MAKKRVNKFANMVRREPDKDSKEVIKELVHHEIKNSELNFDYSKLEINNDSKEELIGIERELKHHQGRFKELSLDMAKALTNAREIFIKSHSESFIDWYESLGFNKNQVSALINKYKLVLEFPDKEENIVNLTDKQIIEVINKKTPDFLKEKILNGEKISAAEIKRERENISSRKEKLSEEIEEAELVEKKISYYEFEKIFVEIGELFVDLEDELLKNGGSEAQFKLAKEILEIAKKLK